MDTSVQWNVSVSIHVMNIETERTSSCKMMLRDHGHPYIQSIYSPYFVIYCTIRRYQLIPAQVSPEYREEYTRLMKRHKVKMKPSDYEEQSLLSSEEQQLPPLSHDDQHQTLS